MANLDKMPVSSLHSFAIALLGGDIPGLAMLGIQTYSPSLLPQGDV